MDRNLMLAVLSMDAYNKANKNIGFAINSNAQITPEMAAAGFGAQAYSYNGETIISYRGTDNQADVVFGRPGGTGSMTPQAMLAVQFYDIPLAQVDNLKFHS
jgi:hypothetical protein